MSLLEPPTRKRQVHAVIVQRDGETYHVLCPEEAANLHDARQIALECLRAALGGRRREIHSFRVFNRYWVFVFAE